MYQLSPGLLGEFKRTQEHMKRQFIGIDTLGMDSETFVVSIHVHVLVNVYTLL